MLQNFFLKSCGILGSVAILWSAGVSPAYAGAVSWFEDPAFPGAYAEDYKLNGQYGSIYDTRFTLELPLGNLRRNRGFPPFSGTTMGSSAVSEPRHQVGADKLSVFGGIASDNDDLRLEELGPILHRPVSRLDEGRPHLLGIKWQHYLNAVSSVAVSTRYGDNLDLDQSLQNVSIIPIDTYSTMTSLSWTGRWVGEMRPSITGSIFIGDEYAKNEAYRNLGRKYYGFTVGGQMTLFQTHRPFVILKMQRSDFLTEETNVYVLRNSDENHSRLTAGWSWQVQPNWSLSAGADYTVEDFELNFYKYNRSRLFFNTRFDFR